MKVTNLITKKRSTVFALSGMMALISLPVQAQTERALERRIDRNARQLQRQANRADYYTNQTWQQLDPWVTQNGVAPLANTARAVRNTVNAAANAVGNTAGAVGNAVKETVDAATLRGDGQFGFNDNDRQNAWFYDYYTYTPTYYQTGNVEGQYASAIRYFDSDSDGIYETQSIYRDSDSDGQYDVYDRLDFYATDSDDANASSDSQSILENGPMDARRHTVEGEIALTKTAKVNGNEHLVVGLKQDGNQTLAVDLGPVNYMKNRDIEIGQSLMAMGAIEQVGDKSVLIADSVRIGNGQMMSIERSSGLSLTGQIVDVKSTQIGSTEHYMAIVQVEGERQLVDLGPTTSYKVRLEPSTQITVMGVPVRSQNHRVIMANRVRLGNEMINIDRLQSRSF